MSVVIAPYVRHALETAKPLVALESTLICHGIPKPRNTQLAHRIEKEVRDAGAVPATIAILDGQIKVGLDRDEIDRLTHAATVRKCSTRELPSAIADGADGATTVASTIFVAAAAGIGIMATGGIGGVHRGGESSLDVSADLAELARSPVAVVCSGAKVILDLPRTLEYLESLGVCVVGFQTDELPAFYTASSGLAIPRCSDMASLADLVHAHHMLGIPGGLVIANPPPGDVAMTDREVDALVADALTAARKAHIAGPATTPFILGHMATTSKGRTVRVNEELVCANARLAAELAVQIKIDRTERAADLA